MILDDDDKIISTVKAHADYIKRLTDHYYYIKRMNRDSNNFDFVINPFYKRAEDGKFELHSVVVEFYKCGDFFNDPNLEEYINTMMQFNPEDIVF